MGTKNMAEKNTRVHVQLGQNFKKCYNFFKFSFEMGLKGYLPESV